MAPRTRWKTNLAGKLSNDAAPPAFRPAKRAMAHGHSGALHSACGPGATLPAPEATGRPPPTIRTPVVLERAPRQIADPAQTRTRMTCAA